MDPMNKFGYSAPFRWKCTHPGCKYEVTAYGTESFRVLKELHLEHHIREGIKAIQNFEKNKKEFEDSLKPEMPPVVEPTAVVPFVPPPPKDYDKLELTVADKTFLKTRGVKVD